MLKGEEVRKAIIPLPANVRTRWDAHRWLGLDELDDVNKPYYVVAVTCTAVADYPFAVLFYVPRESVAKKGWCLGMDGATRIMAIRASRADRPATRADEDSIY